MHILNASLLVITLGLAPDAALLAEIPALNILFIGNSLTYSNDLPNSLRAIAAAEGLTLTTTMQAPGGWTLAQHNSDPTSNALIAQGGWDYVVLQEQSQTAVYNYAAFHAAALALDTKIRAVGARTVLYHNWALNTQAYLFDDYQIAFGSTSSDLCSAWVPAGDAWWELYNNDNATWLSLYADDRHPTPKGTYLTACAFFSVLYGQKPTRPDPVLGLDAATSTYMQDTAWNAVTPWTAIATLSSPDSLAIEGGVDNALLQINVNVPDTLCDIEYFYTVAGTAQAGLDSNSLSGSLFMPRGATMVSLTITAQNDALAEGDETLVITLWGGPWYQRGNPQSVTITLRDPQDSPTPSRTPSASETPSASATTTLTPSPTASPVESLTPTPSASPSSSPAASSTPTYSPSPALSASPSVTNAPSGEGKILQLLAMPNPAQGSFIFALKTEGGPFHEKLRIYTAAMSLVSESKFELSGAGWHYVRVNAAGLAAGPYFAACGHGGPLARIYLLSP